jgi:hypothetical protein
MERVRMLVTLLWQNVATWPLRDQADLFPNMIDEYLFHHAFRAANGDGNYPEVARFMVPAHHWFGRDVPGSRWAGDSPDFIYRTIPIAHGGRYEIRGTNAGSVPPTVNYSLMGDSTASPVTQFLLDSLDMTFEADGSFLITIDSEPANGRPNHIQTKPGADFLMIRDALLDWNSQKPNALEVARLDPDGPPRSEDEMARHYARIALDGVYYAYYCTQSGSGQAPNEIRTPMSSAAFGGMASQVGTKANLVMTADDALIVRSNLAGAGFSNVVLTDVFHMSIGYWERTSSLNARQMTPDNDGDYTFVISARDPGIHNWLDNGGQTRMIFGQRWQAFARDVPRIDPWMNGRLVKFDDLAKELPGGVRTIDSAGRAAQLAERLAGFQRRFAET